MAFNISLQVGGDNCDRCRKPMDEKNPGLAISVTSRGGPKNFIWLHLSCIEWYVLKKGTRLFREWDERNAAKAADIVEAASVKKA